MIRKPSNRLGANGISELKNHPWFKDFNWHELQEGRMEAPYVPSQTVDNFDQNHVNNQEWKDLEQVKEYELLLQHQSTQKLFQGYFYNINASVNQQSNTKATTGGNEIETERVPVDRKVSLQTY
jgi:hypothetical protein